MSKPGFRRYDRIRETLLHELAHMVHSEHDAAFKTLNSQLRRECDEFDWRGAAARSLAGPAFEGSVGYDLPPERQTTMQQTAASSGQTLRQMGGGGAAAPADARLAAAEAALRRSGAAVGAAQGPASAGAQQQQQQQQQFRKGDRVLYRQRDGSLVEATIAAVDVSVQPPSYGIDLPSGYRETEASRLTPAPPAGQQQQQAEEVEGLGHRDAATEAKEAAVAELER
ncbi:zinc metallo ase [Micractinium conductrix]|uniref:Zinc metallo ase n=1 Tax=Micractinium conductrix TaxID=554055 RepID=A0A2P6V5X1_9CHLO|nr:zinc metallo ase [Micractinium conductrix]|eukprot:PSC69486.1 zinc metallo ase [Micractinium conductrix]